MLLIIFCFIEKDPQSTVQEHAPSSRIRKGGRHVANKKLKKANFTLEQAMKAKRRSGSIALIFL
jgi:hypothetical protein